MKNLFFSSFLILAFSITAFSQQRPVDYTIEVDYHMRYLPDSNSTEFRDEYMELLFNSNESVFRSKKKGILDSLSMDEKSGKEPSATNSSLRMDNFTTIRYYIYKIGDSIITQDEFGLANGNFVFYSENKAFDWQITSDTASLHGLTCQKATLDFGGREWIAWFAPEIPIPDGPYKFCGLPGLIVSISDSKGHWTFDMVRLEETDRTVHVEFNNRQRPEFVDKVEYFKSQRHYTINRTQIEEASGILSFPDQANREKSYKWDQERAKRDNNWIELYDAVIR